MSQCCVTLSLVRWIKIAVQFAASHKSKMRSLDSCRFTFIWNRFFYYLKFKLNLNFHSLLNVSILILDTKLYSCCMALDSWTTNGNVWGRQKRSQSSVYVRKCRFEQQRTFSWTSWYLVGIFDQQIQNSEILQQIPGNILIDNELLQIKRKWDIFSCIFALFSPLTPYLTNKWRFVTMAYLHLIYMPEQSKERVDHR